VVREEKQSLTVKLLESLVTVVILLVIVQTFLDDFSIITGWTQNARKILMFTGFMFDLFFTIEFLTRLYNGLTRRRAFYYLVHERGWIDFLASVPLLIFSSSPPLLSYLLGGAAVAGLGGILNILKLIKAIRVARILRLLRILKIFRKIKYTNSRMNQRHLAKVITISVTVIVFAFFGYSVLSELVGSIGPTSISEKREEKVISLLDRGGVSSETSKRQIELFEDEVLLVKRAGKAVFTRYNQEYFSQNFTIGDYSYVKNGEWEIFMDRRMDNQVQEKNQSWQALFFFVMVILLFIFYLVVYSPHFAITVTDPIHVMKRGLDEKDYNLAVKIPETYQDDDIFELSKLYNEVYLPLKDRNQDTEERTDLQIDDIADIFK
jgi:hypothetical protein